MKKFKFFFIDSVFDYGAKRAWVIFLFYKYDDHVYKHSLYMRTRTYVYILLLFSKKYRLCCIVSMFMQLMIIKRC